MSEQKQSRPLINNKNIRIELRRGRTSLFVCTWATLDRQGSISENTVSVEELQILDDLEADIEDDLEREIIDDICRLAHHLQRLYQHKDRRELIRSAAAYRFPLHHAENVVLSEINIRIKLDGQCRIDKTKIEQDFATSQLKSCPSQPNIMQGSTKTRHNDTVYCRKQQCNPVVPWR